MTLRVEARDPMTGRAGIQNSKQRSAVSPNYVHSLDSSHMMLTAMESFRRGIVFAGVHDSFWTHACDVPELALILREKFVQLHSLPLLESFRRQLQASVHDVQIDAPPMADPGNRLDLNEIRRSTYFFS